VKGESAAICSAFFYFYVMKNTFKNIDEYILLFPIEVQKKLLGLRQAIHSQVPDLEEYIGYQMPAFRYKGKPLVYFAGYKKHIGFYPGAEGIRNFEKDFEERNYKFSKGAVQFPITEDLPLDLIHAIVQFKVEETEQKKS
jgi:uncharacterized protein YdhG (YjbR/CyaY superfamily)